MRKPTIALASLLTVLASNSYAFHRATEYKCQGTDVRIKFQQTWADNGTANLESTQLVVKKPGTEAMTYKSADLMATVTPMGLLVSVATNYVADAQTDFSSVVIPLVQLEHISDSLTFDGILVTTTSKTNIGGTALVSGVVEENTFKKLKCEARVLGAPRPAPAPAPTTPAPSPAPTPEVIPAPTPDATPAAPRII